ncbi:hypothetical protein [Solicola gregarius]|uniref:Uncharacterized protein n=1 Tax=Solicola gregarius TaxID=2908642 RepID=A0AA46YKX2_9ACTN|nr:hypothetical protein [Solicola gregarius]UYM06255.1 hypothetical protein L0C25_04030 [Solicola gregarius]
MPRARGRFEAIDLRYEEVRVHVKTPVSGGVERCQLILADAADGDRDPVEYRVPLDPPEGTRAARLAEFQRDRPRLYAARHVVIAAGQILIALVGIGALVRGLLPRIDLPSIDLSWLPDLDFSWMPDPFGWLSGLLPDISPPDWVDSVMGTSKYWLPILIAVFVAKNEAEKRRKANDAKQRRDES